MRCIVWTRNDGTTCITHPAPDGKRVTSVKWTVDGETEVRTVASTTLDAVKVEAEHAGAAVEVLAGESDDEWLARIHAADVPADAINVRVVERDELPTDRTFRNALKHDLSLDMPKAREIWRTKMRVARAAKLSALDVEFQRADEVGDVDKKKDVAQRKQALRDVTKHPDIETAQTGDQLKAVWPSILE